MFSAARSQYENAGPLREADVPAARNCRRRAPRTAGRYGGCNKAIRARHSAIEFPNHETIRLPASLPPDPRPADSEHPLPTRMDTVFRNAAEHLPAWRTELRRTRSAALPESVYSQARI